MTDLKTFLFEQTEHEKQQLATKQFILDFPELQSDSTSHVPRISQQIFGKNKDVYISKHSRFADYPLHSHQFLEINYVYHGHCEQIINGQTYHFQAGDLILMDTDSVQSIKALGEEDILINILFRNKEISLDWLTQLQGQNSTIYQLLLHSSMGQHQERNFAIFSADKTKSVLPILEQLLQEYFFPGDFSDKIIHHYLSILLYQLARTLADIVQETILQENPDPYTQVLDLIDKQYENLTLADAAAELNFNKNYLSNLIKKRSGQTFTQLLHQKRLAHAKLLLESTQLSVQEIAQLAGFSNRSFFYKKFEEAYGMRPTQIRKT